MLKEECFDLILKGVEGRDTASCKELLTMVVALGATLRRDVDQLCEAGRVRKMRGGVTPLQATTGWLGLRAGRHLTVASVAGGWAGMRASCLPRALPLS